MKALVLRKIPFGETDLVVHFLLENGSIFVAFAAGAKKSKKRFAHQFHWAGLYDVDWHGTISPDKMTRCDHCELLEFYPQLSANLIRFSRWMQVLEWIHLDKVGQFKFEEILGMLRSFAAGDDERAYHLFFLKQLKGHGVLPELHHCVHCGLELAEAATILFSLQEGGVTHSGCSKGFRISEHTLKFLREVIQDEDGVPQKISIDVAADLEKISLPYLQHQLAVSMKSSSFYEEIRH